MNTQTPVPSGATLEVEFDDDVTGYATPRRTPTVRNMAHVAELDSEGCWRVIPALPSQALDVDSAEQYVRDLRRAARVARQLNVVELRRQAHPVNAAFSDEIQEIIATHGWRPSEAAVAFNMLAPTLSAKLSCTLAWTLTDLIAIGEAVDPSNPADVVMFLYSAVAGASTADSANRALQYA